VGTQLPLEDILQAIAECTKDLDRADQAHDACMQSMTATITAAQEQRALREAKASEFKGVHRRSIEQIKGRVDVIAPRVHYETNDRAENKHADPCGV